MPLGRDVEGCPVLLLAVLEYVQGPTLIPQRVDPLSGITPDEEHLGPCSTSKV